MVSISASQQEGPKFIFTIWACLCRVARSRVCVGPILSIGVKYVIVSLHDVMAYVCVFGNGN